MLLRKNGFRSLNSIIGSLSLVFVLVILCPVAAQNEWIGDGGDNLWSNPENWSLGDVPAGERVKINGPFAESPNGPVIEDGVEAIAEILISDFGDANMSITGGTLELSGWGAWWGDSATSNATFSMSGGEIEFTGSPGIMELGWQESGDPVGSSVGIWEMTGGEVFAKGVDMPGKNHGGIGVIHLYGGTLNVGSARGGLILYEGATIDITEGQLILEGDQPQVEDYIDDGWILGYGGEGEIMIEEDGDFTIITADGGLPGDFNRNGVLDAEDIDLLSAEVKSMSHLASFDLNSDNLVNADDRRVWIKDLKRTWIGDADLDGEFNSADFVVVFQAGEYEDTVAGNSTWGTGDFNGDMEFDSGDFVIAFQDGGYELGPIIAASVPEAPPSICMVFALGILLRFRVRSR